MIPDEFMAAIIAERADDLPRLIAADWLDEHGESERAEFIRLQIQVAAWPLEKCDSIYPGCSVSGSRVVRHDHKCEMYPLAQRANDLLEISWTDWLPKWVQGCYFYRGFAERITCTWPDWLTHHAAILKYTPLERVVLTTGPNYNDCIPWVNQFFYESWPGEYYPDWESALESHWPGIEFELPRPAWQDYASTYTDVAPDDFITQLRQSINRTQFLPPVQ